MTSALVVLSALHVGFQAVVTVVVYPALVATAPADWGRAHAAHSRRIAVLVAPLYLGLAATCAVVLVQGPSGPATWLALAGQAAAATVTAGLAAPTHHALGRRGPVPELLTRLLVVDRARLAAAVVGLGGALLAV